MVKRFTWDENEGGWTDRTGEIFKPQEELVRASDYDALAERLAKAERLLERIRGIAAEPGGNYAIRLANIVVIIDAPDGFSGPTDSADAVQK